VIPDIREMIAARPFVPFTIHTADGGAAHVPTVDHVSITATGNRVFVSYDDGRYDAIRPLMISRVTVDEKANGSSAQ
jgi:hypothetical protein